MVLKIGIHANFQLRSFYFVKTPTKALETPPSVAGGEYERFY